MYNTFKFIHIAAAIAWVGGGLLFTLMNARTLSTRDIGDLKAITKQGEWFGQRYFGPVAILTLLAGIATVLAGPWAFSELWITLGFVGIFASIIMGAVFVSRTAKQLGAELAEADEFTPSVEALQNRMNMLGIMDVLIVFSVVAVMVFKPTIG